MSFTLLITKSRWELLRIYFIWSERDFISFRSLIFKGQSITRRSNELDCFKYLNWLINLISLLLYWFCFEAYLRLAYIIWWLLRGLIVVVVALSGKEEKRLIWVCWFYLYLHSIYSFVTSLKDGELLTRAVPWCFKEFCCLFVVEGWKIRHLFDVKLQIYGKERCWKLARKWWMSFAIILTFLKYIHFPWV